MSEEQRITKVEKEKDPRRVKAGRRLGTMSKAAKERKAREREDREDREVHEVAVDDDGIGIGTIVAGVGVISCLAGLYFTYKQDKRAEQQTDRAEQPTNSNNAPQPTKSKVRSLD